MRFRLTVPSRLLVDREVVALQAEDETGRFGIREGHEPFLTALVPSVLLWRERAEEGHGLRERFAAVREGVLRVSREGVYVAVRSAEIAGRLEELAPAVRKARASREERSRRSLNSLYQMQIAAWRNLMEYEHVA
jgi:F-type H+-transporting ATPase subunit epsilon